MKSSIKKFAISATLLIPVVSFAQSPAPATRAEVREQLIQLERSGYQPSARDPYYPAKLAAAEARVALPGGVAQAPSTDVGGTMGGATQRGAPVVSSATKSIYFGR